MNHSKLLREEIKNSTLNYIEEYGIEDSKYIIRDTAILFKSDEPQFNPNFLKSSLDNITSNPDWYSRLNKPHSHFNGEINELDSSNSSDALLMNIFCHPKIDSWKGIKNLLGLDSITPKFGWNPDIEKHNSPTEVDMIIGDTIFEAKLTEKDFTSKDRTIINEVYPQMENIIDTDLLSEGKVVNHYQLLRNIYATHINDMNFVLLLDARRTDLINYLFDVSKSIKNVELRKKCNFLTWQDISRRAGKELSSFLTLKYGIR